MSTTRPSITVTCDRCGSSLATTRTTTSAARNMAEGQGWAVSRIYSGESSSDHARRDLCPACNPNYRPPAQPEPAPEPDPKDVLL